MIAAETEDAVLETLAEDAYQALTNACQYVEDNRAVLEAWRQNQNEVGHVIKKCLSLHDPDAQSLLRILGSTYVPDDTENGQELSYASRVAIVAYLKLQQAVAKYADLGRAVINIDPNIFENENPHLDPYFRIYCRNQFIAYWMGVLALANGKKPDTKDQYAGPARFRPAYDELKIAASIGFIELIAHIRR